MSKTAVVKIRFFLSLFDIIAIVCCHRDASSIINDKPNNITNLLLVSYELCFVHFFFTYVVSHC